jgi:hypothetical protein
VSRMYHYRGFVGGRRQLRRRRYSRGGQQMAHGTALVLQSLARLNSAERALGPVTGSGSPTALFHADLPHVIPLCQQSQHLVFAARQGVCE